MVFGDLGLIAQNSKTPKLRRWPPNNHETLIADRYFKIRLQVLKGAVKRYTYTIMVIYFFGAVRAPLCIRRPWVGPASSGGPTSHRWTDTHRDPKLPGKKSTAA